MTCFNQCPAVVYDLGCYTNKETLTFPMTVTAETYHMEFRFNGNTVKTDLTLNSDSLELDLSTLNAKYLYKSAQVFNSAGDRITYTYNGTEYLGFDFSIDPELNFETKTD